MTVTNCPIKSGDVTPASNTPYQEAIDSLKACSADRAKLEVMVSGLLQQLWTESIHIVEEILKETNHPELFNPYKNRVLNVGNRLKRQVPLVLADFITHQVFQRETVVRQMPKGDGPWGLPQGVQFPISRPK